MKFFKQNNKTSISIFDIYAILGTKKTQKKSLVVLYWASIRSENEDKQKNYNFSLSSI